MTKFRQSLRLVLRENLLALMKNNADEGQSALSRRSKVAQSTIGRILAEKGENARVETVERIANAYGLHAWQLLIPGLNPKNPPMLRVQGDVEKALYARLEDALEGLKNLKP